MISRTRSLPTIFAVVTKDLVYGGREYGAGETLWLTATDLLFHRARVRVLHRVREREVRERINLTRALINAWPANE